MCVAKIPRLSRRGRRSPVTAVTGVGVVRRGARSPPKVFHATGAWTSGPSNGVYRVKDVQVYDRKAGVFVPLDPNAVYRVAGNAFTLVEGGDGFAMFDGAVNVLDYVMEDYQVLANYVKSFAPDAEHNNLPTIQSDSIYAEVTGEGVLITAR